MKKMKKNYYETPDEKYFGWFDEEKGEVYDEDFELYFWVD